MGDIMFFKNILKKNLNYLFFFIIIQSILYSKPKRVILFRHGEKEPVYGNLSLKGIERSFLLANYFKKNPQILLNQIPKAFFACEGRTIETITPTAESFPQNSKIPFQPVNVYYSLPDISRGRFRDITYKLSQEILNNKNYDNKVLVVCWEHKNIPLLSHLLGAFQAPDDWADESYDVFWVITYNDKSTNFMIIPQNLLPGDVKTINIKSKIQTSINVKNCM